MSTALEKAAEYSPAQLALLTALIGGGGFGGMRLLTDLHHQLSPLAPPDNKIKLQLPDPIKKEEEKKQHQLLSGMGSTEPSLGSQIPLLSKTSAEGAPVPAPVVPGQQPPPSTPHTWYSPLAAVGLGLPAGFLGTKMLYDSYQDNEASKRIEAAKKRYTEQLMLAQAMNKGAEETPCIDAFCEAMASEFDKVADLGGIASLYNPLNWLDYADKGLGAGMKAVAAHKPQWFGSAPPAIKGVSSADIVNKLPNDPNSLSEASHIVDASGRAGVGSLANKFTGQSYDASKDILKILAAAGAVGTGGILLNSHLKKQDKEQKANYPGGISYAQ